MRTGRIVFLNLADDLLAACTSILAYDSNGNLWHARNLDYGAFLGCALSALLRFPKSTCMSTCVVSKWLLAELEL